MQLVSETEKAGSPLMDQTLEALPTVRRWLLRSARTRPEGGGPPTPLSHVRVIIHLFQRGPQGMSELAHGLGVSCSTATECVAALEERGRVLRERSPVDRRRVVVSLTRDAEAVASEVLSQRRLVVQKTFEQLSSNEARAFVKGLRLLANHAESWMDQAPPSAKSNGKDKGALSG